MIQRTKSNLVRNISDFINEKNSDQFYHFNKLLTIIKDKGIFTGTASALYYDHLETRYRHPIYDKICAFLSGKRDSCFEYCETEHYSVHFNPDGTMLKLDR